MGEQTNTQANAQAPPPTFYRVAQFVALFGFHSGMLRQDGEKIKSMKDVEELGVMIMGDCCGVEMTADGAVIRYLVGKEPRGENYDFGGALPETASSFDLMLVSGAPTGTGIPIYGTTMEEAVLDGYSVGIDTSGLSHNPQGVMIEHFFLSGSIVGFKDWVLIDKNQPEEESNVVLLNQDQNESGIILP